MAEFLRLPAFEIGERHLWVTRGELEYRSDLYPVNIIVPSGFKTDLASIPVWVPEFIIRRNGPHRKAAVVHDYLVRAWPLEQRPLADRIFLEAMKISGVPGWKRYIMYAAVAALTLALRLTGAKKAE